MSWLKEQKKEHLQSYSLLGVLKISVTEELQQ